MWTLSVMPITMMIAEFLCNVRNGQGGFKQPYIGHPWVHHIFLILRSKVKKKRFKAHIEATLCG